MLTSLVLSTPRFGANPERFFHLFQKVVVGDQRWASRTSRQIVLAFYVKACSGFVVTSVAAWLQAQPRFNIKRQSFDQNC